MNLNVMGGDRFTAEMEIITELIAHYDDLTRKIQDNVNKAKASLDHFKDTNQTIKSAYDDSKRELNLLEDQLQ